MNEKKPVIENNMDELISPAKDLYKRNLLVITDIPFPFGVAMSARIRAFCKLFGLAGYAVHVIALHKGSADIKVNRVYYDTEYSYEIVSDKAATVIESFIGNKEFSPYIKNYIIKNKVDLIFSSSCQNYFKAILKLAKKFKIPYYIEQCEKFDINSYKLGKLDPRRIRFLNLYNKGYNKVTGVIAISRFLKSHYEELGVSAIRIPTIIDVENTKYSLKKASEKIELVLTGNASGKKELVSPIIEALYNNPVFKEKFRFNIYGTPKQRLIADCPEIKGMLNELENVVIFNGRVPQEEIENIIRNSTFQIFIRPDRESSHAGFPTKLGESMAVGTPVISNDTGDICLYLKDSVNGFVLGDSTEQAVTRVFKKILIMSEKDISEMRKNARKTAEQSFDIEVYTDSLKKFITNNT